MVRKLSAAIAYLFLISSSWALEPVFVEIPNDSSLTAPVRTLPPLGQVHYSQLFLMDNDWRESALSKFDAMAEYFSGQKLLPDDDSHVLAVKVILTLDRPITDFSKDTLLNANFHQEASQTIQLKPISTAPLQFHAIIESVLTLEATLNVEALTADLLSQDSRLNSHLLNQYTQLPNSMSVRYATNFNRVLNSLLTTSQFYEITSDQTLVVSWAFMSIRNGPFTTSMLSKRLFRNQVSDLLKKVVKENVKFLYEFNR